MDYKKIHNPSIPRKYRMYDIICQVWKPQATLRRMYVTAVGTDKIRQMANRIEARQRAEQIAA